MKRAWVGLAALLLVPFATDPVDAQNTCVTATWTDVAGGTTIRPETDEYRGRITFTRQSGCPVGCPDGTSSQASFELLNQETWLRGNFTQNPVPINGSAGPLSSRTTQNEIVVTLDRSAPAENSFVLRVRARCSQTSEISRVFRVGALVDVNATIEDASTTTDGARWTIAIQNRGTTDVHAELHPRPPDGDTWAWEFSAKRILLPPQGDRDGVYLMQASVAGERIPNNLSVTLLFFDEPEGGVEIAKIELPLTYTVFSGKSTSAPSALAWTLLVALVAVFRRRLG